MVLISLKCKNCGADVHVSQGTDHFFCTYCRSEHRVEYSKGHQLVATAQAIQQGTDRTAAELALPRLEKELQELSIKQEAMRAVPAPAPPKPPAKPDPGTAWEWTCEFFSQAKHKKYAEQLAEYRRAYIDFPRYHSEWLETHHKRIAELKSEEEHIREEITLNRSIVSRRR
jgi:hypothetical protein